MKTGTRPTIVCLCGSTRFYKEFILQNYNETMAGNIVLTVGSFPNALTVEHKDCIPGMGIAPHMKEKLDELHKRKIDLADEVFILNCGGYIGESTQSELEYALALGKTVRFLEPIDGQ